MVSPLLRGLPMDRRRTYHDGRDEMNLADFPISALQRQQPREEDGRKLDRLEFEATRYDVATRRRVSQRVTLTSTARDGLPTPADEHVILALLYVAKHDDNFSSTTVRFAPSQLFDIMGWAPNGRSYARLRDVLRRLKSLTIRYENAWWDAAGRGYEEELATGIVAAYRIARQVSGPRTASSQLLSWVTWTPQFHDSLRHGNLKRLDLEVFFRLRSPTAQRMYRFLDKRFYNTSCLVMDLMEFACGHVGLTESDNVAILKRRLAPAIAELEEIGFLAPLPLEERFQKVQAGVWRVTLQANKSRQEIAPPPAAPVESTNEKGLTPQAVAGEFYRLWGLPAVVQPGPRDLGQAEALLRDRDADQAMALVAALVEVTRKSWPECRSFSGAVQKYLGDAGRLVQQRQQREARRHQAEAQRQQESAEERERRELERRRMDRWQALAESEQAEVRRRVVTRLAGAFAPEPFLQRLCLEEMVRSVAEEAVAGTAVS